LGDLSSAGGGIKRFRLTLASNTTITAANFNIGNSQRIQPQTLKLGSGSNVFMSNCCNWASLVILDKMFLNTGSGTFKNARGGWG